MGASQGVGGTAPCPKQLSHPLLCPAAAAPPPELTSAQAFGPNSATATATGASNVTWARWRFSATPTSGPALVQEAASPLVWWYNLAADTTCERGEVRRLSAVQGHACSCLDTLPYCDSCECTRWP